MSAARFEFYDRKSLENMWIKTQNVENSDCEISGNFVHFRSLIS